jgi:gamma-glutamyltranspeptidase/glutathione hydrolase
MVGDQPELPWKDLFQPAIAFAEQGYPVYEGMNEIWAGQGRGLSSNPESSRVFLPNGKPPATGQIFKNPGMGKAFRLVAEKGPDAFYKGEIAEALVNTSKHLGGTMTMEDLAAFSPEWVEPISIDYRGWRVYELPPNGQGVAALEMLKIMATVRPRRRAHSALRMAGGSGMKLASPMCTSSSPSENTRRTHRRAVVDGYAKRAHR